jgi:hypothetical protein
MKVYIEFHDINHDWKYYEILAAHGDEIWIKGIYDEDIDAEHDGTTSVAKLSEIKTFESLEV